MCYSSLGMVVMAAELTNSPNSHIYRWMRSVTVLCVLVIQETEGSIYDFFCGLLLRYLYRINAFLIKPRDEHLMEQLPRIFQIKIGGF